METNVRLRIDQLRNQVNNLTATLASIGRSPETSHIREKISEDIIACEKQINSLYNILRS